MWSGARFSAADRVLDIGSPKLLSLYLAERVGAEVYSTDLEPHFIDEYEYLARVRGVPEQRFHAAAADGTELPYNDDYFTAIYSISVIEHIPDTGDSACLAEIGRVLRPGGRCLITVPFWPSSRDKFREPDFYWAGAMPATQDGRVFFQRRYSPDDLIERLIRPSGLEVSQTLFVGERVMVQSEREFDDVLPVITGPIQPLLSRAVHTAR